MMIVEPVINKNIKQSCSVSYKIPVFQGSANNVTGGELIELGDEVMDEINTGQQIKFD